MERQWYRKIYYPLINPMELFPENKFVERYHLSKELVWQITEDYVARGFCSTALTGRGGGLSAEEHVSTSLIDL